ncbi:MAG: dicarboxylate/amino acid:cation symporter, partial [Fimbriimonadales bacterium]|nr:dicarboxylate/amino acid:cation symporter [Fimbriimonadales bacterium]
MSEAGSVKAKRETVAVSWVLVGIGVGIVGGLWLHGAGGEQHPLFSAVNLGADLFIRLLRMVIVPLIAASLITAAAGLDTRHLGRLGGLTFVYYLSTTLFAAALGLVIVNLIDPGMGAVLKPAELPEQLRTGQPPTFADLLRNLIPINPIDALVRADMLQIISFSLIAGIALNFLGERGLTVRRFFEEVLELSMLIVRWVLML